MIKIPVYKTGIFYICLILIPFSVKPLILIFVSFFILFSCKKEKDPLLLLHSPSWISYIKKPGDVIRIEISGSSGNTLSHFKVHQREINSVSTLLLDSIITGNKFSYTLEYKVPLGYDSTKYYIELSLYDNSGAKITSAISVLVNPINLLLTETAGHELFSHASNGFDSYNLALGIPLHSEVADSSIMNILEMTNDTINPNTLIRKWSSPAGNKFVRFNDFDYANSTFNSLKYSYNAGIKNNFIQNIQNGDIVLTKLGNSAKDTGYVAIKIVMVIDEDSTNLDRYIFNLKKLR